MKSALPPQRLKPDTQLVHQDSVSHLAQKKSEKKTRKKEKINKNKFTKMKKNLIIKNKKVIKRKKERAKKGKQIEDMNLEK